MPAAVFGKWSYRIVHKVIYRGRQGLYRFIFIEEYRLFYEASFKKLEPKFPTQPQKYSDLLLSTP